MSEELQFEDLKLLPGTKIDLRSEQYAQLKGASAYVGYRTQRGIIVSTPLKGGNPIACKIGNTLVVRLFANHLNCACAFRTEIIHVSTIPFAHLHLAIPEQMEIGEVRNSARANVQLIASIFSTETKTSQSATINNISADGARVHSKLAIGNIGDAIKISTKIKVLEIENIVKVDGIIRSCTNIDGQLVYGIQFDNIDDQTKLAIYALVMTQLTS